MPTRKPKAAKAADQTEDQTTDQTAEQASDQTSDDTQGTAKSEDATAETSTADVAAAAAAGDDTDGTDDDAHLKEVSGRPRILQHLRAVHQDAERISDPSELDAIVNPQRSGIDGSIRHAETKTTLFHIDYGDGSNSKEAIVRDLIELGIPAAHIDTQGA